MDCSNKELEDIDRLMEFAEEGLNQVNNLIEGLTVDGEKLQELINRANLLQTNLVELDEKRRLLTAFRLGFHI